MNAAIVTARDPQRFTPETAGTPAAAMRLERSAADGFLKLFRELQQSGDSRAQQREEHRDANAGRPPEATAAATPVPTTTAPAERPAPPEPERPVATRSVEPAVAPAERAPAEAAVVAPTNPREEAGKPARSEMPATTPVTETTGTRPASGGKAAVGGEPGRAAALAAAAREAKSNEGLTSGWHRAAAAGRGAEAASGRKAELAAQQLAQHATATGRKAAVAATRDDTDRAAASERRATRSTDRASGRVDQLSQPATTTPAGKPGAGTAAAGEHAVITSPARRPATVAGRDPGTRAESLPGQAAKPASQPAAERPEFRPDPGAQKKAARAAAVRETERPVETGAASKSPSPRLVITGVPGPTAPAPAGPAGSLPAELLVRHLAPAAGPDGFAELSRLKRGAAPAAAVEPGRIEGPGKAPASDGLGFGTAGKQDTPAAAAAEKPAATARPATSEALRTFRELVKDARVHLADGKTEMRLQLKPEHLGRLTIRLEMDGDSVNAKFVTDNPATQKFLEANLPQLRESFAAQGFEFTGCSVELGTNQANEREDAAAGGTGSGERPADGGDADDGDRVTASFVRREYSTMEYIV